ncbi:MAG: crotonase/enoyl-CoA hydratase family protein [Actinomycetia bacterium]|nr:crotonase/enoyl-CoA hydratase family protein [Actinomycetes bacterium]MCP4086362.1 crotonase/enoyl-CoA hydratase family protein [Actinomycetes bacterium]
MTHECFTVDTTEKVAHVRMSRPQRFNSMIPAFWTELPTIIDEISASGTARAIVLSGEGKHFCAGMDLAVFTGGDSIVFGDASSPKPYPSRQRANFRLTALAAQEAFNALERSRVPVLAAIQGGCIGGGIDMVSACDMRYADESAFFCIQEINIGMTADVGTLQRMPKLVPEGVVRELAYTGRNMSADEAHRIGFVNQVYPDQETMLDGVLETAAEIASKSPMAVWGTKQTMHYARDHSVADGLEYIATWNAAMFDTDDMAEAFASQKEGRPAEFPDLAPESRGI